MYISMQVGGGGVRRWVIIHNDLADIYNPATTSYIAAASFGAACTYRTNAIGAPHGQYNLDSFTARFSFRAGHATIF